MQTQQNIEIYFFAIIYRSAFPRVWSSSWIIKVQQVFMSDSFTYEKSCNSSALKHTSYCRPCNWITLQEHVHVKHWGNNYMWQYYCQQYLSWVAKKLLNAKLFQQNKGSKKHKKWTRKTAEKFILENNFYIDQTSSFITIYKSCMLFVATKQSFMCWCGSTH